MDSEKARKEELGSQVREPLVWTGLKAGERVGYGWAVDSLWAASFLWCEMAVTSK